jgi:ketosteroid isomerase-like protein
MSGPWKRESGARVALALAVLIGLVALAACGGSSTATSSSPSAPAATPSASPSIVPAAEPVSQWDAAGTASAAQTRAVANKYATTVAAGTLPKVGLYAKDATWDYWESDMHGQGATTIEDTYRSAADSFDWYGVHVLSAPGVAADEGTLKAQGTTTTTVFLALLAADGNKVVHEEVFLDNPSDSKKQHVTFAASAPGPKDTAKAAARVAAAVGDAFAAGDQAALQDLLAPDVLFYDTELTHGVRGADAVLAWQSKTPTVEVSNQEPIAGPGWAVVRWTIRGTDVNGIPVAMPGATVMETRDGQVVRMTLYYDNAALGLQE